MKRLTENLLFCSDALGERIADIVEEEEEEATWRGQFHRYDIIWASSGENLSSGCPKKLDSNQSPQLQRLARKLQFHL